MVVLRDNVFVDSYFIEDKRFSVSLGRDGGIVRLLEESKKFSFSIFSEHKYCGVVGEGHGRMSRTFSRKHVLEEIRGKRLLSYLGCNDKK